MEFTADQVWACAVAIDRINGGYFKVDQWMMNATPPYLDKKANKVLIKEWLRTNDFVEVTEADREEGQRIRAHFNSYTFLALQGKINDFQHQALKIAQMETFTSRNMLELSIVSCLPDVARRDAARAEFLKDVYASEQLNAQVGDVIVGDITVIRSRYSQEYNKFKIDARMGESVVDFWFTKELKGELRIKAKVKQHRGNKTTQLNYVKTVG